MGCFCPRFREEPVTRPCVGWAGPSLSTFLDGSRPRPSTPTPYAVMVSKRRAKKSELRSPLFKPRPDAGLFLCRPLIRQYDNVAVGPNLMIARTCADKPPLGSLLRHKGYLPR